jgi:hypothetical protein
MLSFDTSQIEVLKKHYNSIPLVDVNSETYLSLEKFVRNMEEPLLAQLADENIRWLSYIARREMMARRDLLPHLEHTLGAFA